LNLLRWDEYETADVLYSVYSFYLMSADIGLKQAWYLSTALTDVSSE